MALAHFQRTFTDASGNVKPGLSVTVRRESDNGLAALFSDAGSVTPKSNPFSTDASGYGSFYVTDGRYRIQATDIDWRNEDLISQPSPNFTSMPQVGGDPVVESGSNADGEFTRWADGTQIVRKHFGSSIGNTNTYTIQGVTFFRKERSVTYAAAFVSNPTISLSFNQNIEDIFLSNYYASRSNTTIDIQFISLLSFSSYSFSSGYLTATGRWK
jgi:hypothetical protein